METGVKVDEGQVEVERWWWRRRRRRTVEDGETREQWLSVFELVWVGTTKKQHHCESAGSLCTKMYLGRSVWRPTVKTSVNVTSEWRERVAATGKRANSDTRTAKNISIFSLENILMRIERQKQAGSKQTCSLFYLFDGYLSGVV